jgi:hypothetical protein
MTVSSTTSKVSYSGNGSTVAFTVTFYFLADADIKVLVRSANGTEVVKTLNTDYTITGAGDPAGGTVTFGTAPASGQTVVLARNVPLTQVTDYTPNDPFPAETHERALDKLTQVTQQINEAVDRSIKLSLSNTMTSTEFTVDAATRANKVLGFDAAGELAVTQEIGTYRGNWASGTAYQQRDIIKDTSNANIYICVTAHTSTGSQPISSNTDSAKWALLVDAASASAAQAAAEAAQAAAEAAQAAAETAQAAAETAESNAETAETNAETAETNAEAAQTAAEAARDLTLATYDAFDDRYLGSKSSNPTVDNDGNTLLDGALYWNTVANEFRVYDLGATTWRKTVPTDAEQANINTVSSNISNVNTVAGISANVTTVAGISANVTTVATNNANVTTVATNIANVNTVGGISSNVTTVAGIAADVTSVAGNATDISAVADIDSDVSTVAGIAADISLVASDSVDIATVAADIAKVIEVANDLQETTSEIDTVANNIADVNTVGTNIADVITVAGAAADIATVADNITDIYNYADTYQGAKATAPSVRNDSSALQAGDLYFNTTDDQMKVFDGAGWGSVGSTVNGTSQRYRYIATSGQTSFTGVDSNSNTLAYDVGFIDVYLNGLRLDQVDYTATSGDTIVLASAAALNDELNVVTYGNFELADVYTKSASDARFRNLSVDIPVADIDATGTPSASTFLRGDGAWEVVTQTRISGGTTGLTPSTLTGGDVTLGGTLAAANGGTGLTSPGTSGNVLTSDGTAWTSAASSFTGARGEAFTSSGTFTVPAGVSAVKVTVIGGGGGGATRTTNGLSAGGGGAGVAIQYITGLTPGGTVSVTVGAGGAGSTAGGTSSFGAYCSATGGGGAATNTDVGGTGGTASGGTFNFSGGKGARYGFTSIGSYNITGVGGGSGAIIDASSVQGGTNENTELAPGQVGFFAGFGGYGKSTNLLSGASFGGEPGTGYGNGGSGSYRTSGTQTGGSGSGGLVLVEW